MSLFPDDRTSALPGSFHFSWPLTTTRGNLRGWTDGPEDPCSEDCADRSKHLDCREGVKGRESGEDEVFEDNGGCW